MIGWLGRKRLDGMNASSTTTWDTPAISVRRIRVPFGASRISSAFRHIETYCLTYVNRHFRKRRPFRVSASPLVFSAA